MTARVWDDREGQVERLLLILMGARLALAVVSLGIGLGLDAMGRGVAATEWPGFYVTVLLCFVATLVYRTFLGRIRRPTVFAAINVATDLVLVSALVGFSGGKDSIFTFLYVVVVLYGSTLFPGWGVLACSAAGSLAYGSILALGSRGWLVPAAGAEPLGVLLTSWLGHATALLAAAGLSGHLGRELRRTGIALHQRTQDLEHLRTLHERTVESLRSGLLTTDLSGRITSFNREAQRITGLSRGEALGRELEEVLPESSALTARTGISGAGRARMPFRAPSGESLHLGVGAYALRDGAGNAEGEVVIFQDVTEVVAMEQELRRSERLAAVGELSASIAHEIRNPLAAISGSIQVMQRSTGVPDGESRRLMGIVVREVDRLDALIGDFLQFARPGAPRIEEVAVAGVVREVFEMFEATRPAGVSVEEELEAGLSVAADPNQLRQVLWNLLLNAAQAMPEGGRIRIAARAREPEPSQGDASGGRMDEDKPVWAEITVMDQGAGIPADVVEHVFDPFFTTKAGGTGLGLAIVHRVIAEHRGVVRVEAGVGEFRTAMRLLLPRAEGTS